MSRQDVPVLGGARRTAAFASVGDLGAAPAPRHRCAARPDRRRRREDVALSLAPNVTMLPDGSVHVRRPGLAPVIGNPTDEAMAYLRGLPLDEDARTALAATSDLLNLRSPSQVPPGTVQFGVARSAGGEPAAITPTKDDSCIFRTTDLEDPTNDPGSGNEFPPPPPTTGSEWHGPPRTRTGLLAFFSGWPYRYRMVAAVVLAVGLAAGAAGGAYAVWGRDDNKPGGVLAASANPRTVSATPTGGTPPPSRSGTPDLPVTAIATVSAKTGGALAGGGQSGDYRPVAPSNTSGGVGSLGGDTGAASGGSGASPPAVPAFANTPVPTATNPSARPNTAETSSPPTPPLPPTSTSEPPTRTPTPPGMVAATGGTWLAYTDPHLWHPIARQR